MKLLRLLAALILTLVYSQVAKPSSGHEEYQDEHAVPSALHAGQNVTINGKVHFLSDEQIVPNDVMQACYDFGMSILNLETEEENSQIKQFLVDNENQELRGLNYWTGGHKMSDGTYMWTNGVLFTYSDWAVGQPDEPTSVACIYLNADLGWFDYSCNNTFRYICEDY